MNPNMDPDISPTPAPRGSRTTSLASPPPSATARFVAAPKPSFNERKANSRTQRSSLEPVIEGDARVFRGVRQPPPGDVTRLSKARSKPELAQKRSQYFEEAFQWRRADAAREDVRADSMVLVEVKTNVMIDDKYTFITELALHLSTRYSRPVTSIIISLHHSMCVLFGGNFQPAYTITITALPCQVQPATNKRNIALLQRHLEQALKVSPARGFVRFIAASEENCGLNGRTGAVESADAVGRLGPDAVNNRTPGRRTIRSLSLRRFPSKHAAQDSQSISSNRPHEDPSATPVAKSRPETLQADTSQAKYIRPKRSFIHSLFVRSQKPDREVSSRSSAPGSSG